MLELITDPFSGGIAQRALLEVVILGLVCGPLGVWVVLYQQSYAAESISHSMLPGLVIAALVGVPLGLGAAVGLLVAVAMIAAVATDESIGADTAVAVGVTALFGFGSLLALSPQTPIGLGELLFGDPLSVRADDLIASGVLALLTGAVLAGAHRTLTLSCFDPASAASLGGSNRSATWLVLGLIAATTLVAVQALGSLLVVAVVIGPAAAALRLQSRLRPALWTAAFLAVTAGVGGLYVSHYLELAAGASIALAAFATFVLTLPVRAPGRVARRLAPR